MNNDHGPALDTGDGPGLSASSGPDAPDDPARRRVPAGLAAVGVGLAPGGCQTPEQAAAADVRDDRRPSIREGRRLGVRQRRVAVRTRPSRHRHGPGLPVSPSAVRLPSSRFASETDAATVSYRRSSIKIARVINALAVT